MPSGIYFQNESTMTHRALISLLCVALTCGIPAAAGAAAPASSPSKLSLQKIDTKPGSGRLAMTGSTVSIHYTGWLYAPDSSTKRGARFDSSNDAAPFRFKLGAGGVIKGWDEGIRGMKVGGKRTIIIPAEMGFGKDGLGPVPAGANLIFDIELIDAK